MATVPLTSTQKPCFEFEEPFCVLEAEIV